MSILLLIVLLIFLPSITKPYKARQAARHREQVKQAIQAEREQAKQEAAAEKARQREEKAVDRINREVLKRQAQAERDRLKQKQASEDLPFFEIQLDRLYITAEDTRNQYRRAVETVNHDNDLNRFGAVINSKVTLKHISERDHLLKKLITFENQIHALEKKRTAAENILTRD